MVPMLGGQRDPVTATSTTSGRAEREVMESNSVLPAPRNRAGWRHSCSAQPDPTHLTQAAKVGASPRAQGPLGLPSHHGCPLREIPHLRDLTSPRTVVLANLAAEPALQRKGACPVCLCCQALLVPRRSAPCSHHGGSHEQHPAEL